MIYTKPDRDYMRFSKCKNCGEEIHSYMHGEWKHGHRHGMNDNTICVFRATPTENKALPTPVFEEFRG